MFVYLNNMKVESNTIEVQAKHPTDPYCPLKDFGYILYWKETDWSGLGLTVAAAIEIVREKAAKKNVILVEPILWYLIIS